MTRFRTGRGAGCLIFVGARGSPSKSSIPASFVGYRPITPGATLPEKEIDKGVILGRRSRTLRTVCDMTRPKDSEYVTLYKGCF